VEQRSISEESIFGIARKIDSPDARDAYLAQVCGNDQALRERVASLLSAHADAASFLESPAPEFDATSAQTSSEEPGTIIGPYKLLEQIGEGGMGVVYMADQQAPVRRRVALKIIKPGMDTRQVIARFEAERQALALMDHSNIARVLDAATTVMELVRGVPITEYCDKNNLPVHERLELFVQVCQAVQHAHQKGIIHRDIKPSNVLVTLVDGRPVPKVIDFGVAKAINQQLTDKTLFTNFAQMIGTPLYMSPEQAEMTSLDVDTRSDIYSLGVLLYELLTGTTPFDQKRLREAAFDEIRRIIREEEPPQPSTRISTLGDQRTVTAAHRKVDPNRLSQLLRGDLDWIVMKSIEKDRTRRYETANGLARDIDRYLHDQPVEACPPSAVYRFRKFARRNRVGLATALLVSAALVMGTVFSTWQAVRATRAERIADAERAEAEANFQKARAAVDKYFTLVSESTLLDVPGLQPLRMKLLESALDFYRGLANEHVNDPAVLADLAVTYIRFAEINHANDRNDSAVEAVDQALVVIDRLRREHPAEHEHQRKLAGYWKGNRSMHVVTEMPKDPQAAFQSINRLVETWQALAEEYPDELGFRSDLAAMYYRTGDLLVSSGQTAKGLAYTMKAKSVLEKLTHEQPKTPVYRADLAACYEHLARNGRKEEVESNWREALAIRERLVVESPQVSQYRMELAFNQAQVASCLADRDPAEAERLFRRAIEITDQLVTASPSAPMHFQRWLNAQNGLVDLLVKMGRETQANEQRLYGAQFVRQLERDDHGEALELEIALGYGDAGDALAASGRREEGLAMIRQAIPHYEKLAANPDCAARVRSNLGHCYRWIGGLENDRKAAAIFARLMAEVPSYKAYQEQLVSALFSIGVNLTRERDFAAAEANFQRAIVLNGRLADGAPENFGCRGNLAGGQRTYGDMLLEAGRADEGLAAHRASLAMFELLTRDEPDHRFWWQEAAYGHLRVGHICLDAGDLPEAKNAFLKALPIHEKLVAQSGQEPFFVERLLWSRRELLELALREKHFADAAAWARSMAAAQPDGDLEFKVAPLLVACGDRDGYAGYCHDLLDRYVNTDRPEIAERTAKACLILPPPATDLPTLVALAQKALDLSGDGFVLPYALASRGLAAYRQGDFAAALQWCGTDRLSRESDTSFHKLQVNLVLAMAHQRLGHPDQAQQLLTSARSILREADEQPINKLTGGGWHDWLIARALEREAWGVINTEAALEASIASPNVKSSDDAHPSEPNDRVEMGHRLWQSANLASSLGQHDEAEKIHRRALDVFEKLAADAPTVAFYRQEQGFSCWHLGSLMKNTGRPHDAEEPMRQALAIHAKLAADFPNEHEYRARLARSYTALIDVLLPQGKHAEAEETRRQAMKTFEELAVAHPSVPDFARFRADSLHGLAQLQTSNKQLKEAEETDRQAIDAYQKIIATFPQHDDLGLVYMSLAPLLAGSDRPVEAADAYRKALERIPSNTEALNNVAWALATSADVRLRNPALAVEFAKKATELLPQDANLQNTLGVAHYRAGDWQDAIAWLDKSMKGRIGGDSNDWFFLAMAHEQLGHKGEARKWFDKAVEWMEKQVPQNEELLRFRREAEDLLVGKPAADANSEIRE
jgi:serine/threonine protein kinase/tetratricopeptide (TPR) repeat protein